MGFEEGEAIELAREIVMNLYGKEVWLPKGLTGRVCKLLPHGFACVQFAGHGCHRIHEDRLVTSGKAAPACSERCRQTC